LFYHYLGDKQENIYFRRSTPVATAWMCGFRDCLQIGICSGGRWPSKWAFNQKM